MEEEKSKSASLKKTKGELVLENVSLRANEAFLKEEIYRLRYMVNQRDLALERQELELDICSIQNQDLVELVEAFESKSGKTSYEIQKKAFEVKLRIKQLEIETLESKLEDCRKTLAHAIKKKEKGESTSLSEYDFY